MKVISAIIPGRMRSIEWRIDSGIEQIPILYLRIILFIPADQRFLNLTQESALNK